MTLLKQRNGKWAIEDASSGEIIKRDFNTEYDARQFIEKGVKND